MQDQHASQMHEYFSQYLLALNMCKDETGVTTVLGAISESKQSELDSKRHERARLYARPACGLNEGILQSICACPECR
eukprot:COSAG05_NODE_1316_length_5210_cov_51.150851_2_plen_78_part_00